MTEGKRTRRTPEEMAAARDEKIAQLELSIQEIESKKAASIAEYDAKIAAVKAKIQKLKEQKKPGRKPTKRRRTQAIKMQEILKQARKAGLSVADIADKLGLAVEE